MFDLFCMIKLYEDISEIFTLSFCRGTQKYDQTCHCRGSQTITNSSLSVMIHFYCLSLRFLSCENKAIAKDTNSMHLIISSLKGCQYTLSLSKRYQCIFERISVYIEDTSIRFSRIQRHESNYSLQRPDSEVPV